MANKIIALLYILSSVVITICAPLGAILVIVKACGSSALSWLGACVPVIIALAVVPIYVLTKTLIDTRSGK